MMGENVMLRVSYCGDGEVKESLLIPIMVIISAMTKVLEVIVVWSKDLEIHFLLLLVTWSYHNMC